MLYHHFAFKFHYCKVKFFKHLMQVLIKVERSCSLSHLAGTQLFRVGDYYHPSLSIPSTFSASVTRKFSHFVSPFNIFSWYIFLGFRLSQDVLLSLFSSHCQKRLPWCLGILFTSDLVVSLSASPNPVLFDFFAVHEIHSILCMNHISVADSFFCSCFEIVQAS